MQKNPEEQLIKLLASLAALEIMEEQYQKKQQKDLMFLLQLLASTQSREKKVLQLVSCCQDTCKCESKSKKVKKWQHHCGGDVYQTNQGTIMCEKCGFEKAANYWYLYCQNETADNYNYPVNSLENCIFNCGESLKQVKDKKVAADFLKEYYDSLKAKAEY